MKMKMATVKLVQAARKAGLDMREVSERLDAAVGIPDGLRRWRQWVREEILRKGHESELVLGH
jgi:hypothetical protein